MSGARDYRRFLNGAGELNVRLLPRDVYSKLVTAYRNRSDVIDEVFGAFYLGWDLRQELAAQTSGGAEIDKSIAAQAVLDSLDDGDWWRVMAAFEQALIRDFIAVASDWSELLDPIYDDQEIHGWRDLQP